MKIIFSTIIIILLTACGIEQEHNLNKSNIKSFCKEIIIVDSTDSKSINFVVTYKNLSDRSLVLFNNNCYKKTRNDSYVNAGMTLVKNNFNTPIGNYLPKTILIPSKQSKVILYTYSSNLPNNWLKINDTTKLREELTKISKDVLLYYRYDPNQVKKMFSIKEVNDIGNAATIGEDFQIEKINPKITYKNLYFDDIVKISGGEIRH